METNGTKYLYFQTIDENNKQSKYDPMADMARVHILSSQNGNNYLIEERKSAYYNKYDNPIKEKDDDKWIMTFIRNVDTNNLDEAIEYSYYDNILFFDTEDKVKPSVINSNGIFTNMLVNRMGYAVGKDVDDRYARMKLGNNIVSTDELKNEGVDVITNEMIQEGFVSGAIKFKESQLYTGSVTFAQPDTKIYVHNVMLGKPWGLIWYRQDESCFGASLQEAANEVETGLLLTYERSPELYEKCRDNIERINTLNRSLIKHFGNLNDFPYSVIQYMPMAYEHGMPFEVMDKLFAKNDNPDENGASKYKWNEIYHLCEAFNDGKRGDELNGLFDTTLKDRHTITLMKNKHEERMNVLDTNFGEINKETDDSVKSFV